MPRWTLQGRSTGRVVIEADSWTEALAVAFDQHFPHVHGSRFLAHISADGKVQLDRDGGEDAYTLSSARSPRHFARQDTDAYQLFDSCRYIPSGGPELYIPFGVTDEATELDETEPAPPTAREPDEAPPGFECDVDHAAERFAATEARTLTEHAWAAIALWLNFVDCDAVGLRCSDGHTESWFARQGPTRGLAGSATTLRRLARRTGTSWAIYDSRSGRAGMICPLASQDVGEGDYRNGTLEAWRSGSAFRDWQLEVGMLAGTLLSERLDPTAVPMRRAG